MAYSYDRRTAMEHPTEDARKKYLHDHPKADPHNHSVQQKSQESKGQAAPDHSAASSHAGKAESRFDENRKLFKSMESGKDPEKAHKKLQNNGDAAQKASQELLKKYDDDRPALKGKAKRNFEAAMEWMHICIREWQSNREGGGAHSAEDRRSNTYAAAQQLDASLKAFPSALQGKEEVLDDSWRKD